jgi:hypothetical protein
MKKQEKTIIEDAKDRSVKYIRELKAVLEMRETLCETQGISIEMLKSSVRDRPIIRVRQAFTSASVSFCEKLPASHIAALIGRDHATATHYTKDETGTHHTDYVQDKEYAAIYDEAREILEVAYFNKDDSDCEIVIDLGLEVALKYARARDIAERIILEIPNGLTKLENVYRTMQKQENRLRSQRNKGSWKGTKEALLKL